MAKQQNRLYPLRAERTLPPDTSQLNFLDTALLRLITLNDLRFKG